jgi:uncharacterized protein
MIHEWNRLSFLHWSYEPEVIQAMLPPGLAVDTFGGRAWVGLVPFLMVVHPPRGRAMPWLSRFCETNVRTYVRPSGGAGGESPDGSSPGRAVWFLSLDAARLPAVLTARAGFGLPYFWSEMSFRQHDDEVSYSCRRRWPAPHGASSRVRVGEPYTEDELTGLDHFLTARWRLYMDQPAVALPRGGSPLRHAPAAHDPWLLHRARLLDLDDQLLTAAGLPAPAGDPLVHWTPGTTVRLGRPQRA